MRIAFKRILVVLLSILAFFVAAALIIPLVVDVDKYRPQIAEAANERMNGKLELGKLALSLWGQVRVEVQGLKLNDASGAPVVSVSDAYFHVPFTSLFTGAPTLVFKMQKPVVNVLKDKAGKLNVMGLMKTEPASPEAGQPQGQAKPPAKADPSLRLPTIATQARLAVELRDALLTYKDLAMGFDTEIQDLNVVVKDISLSRPMGIEIWADLDTKLGKTFALRGPARITGTAKPELANGKFERLSLAAKADLDGVEMEVPGVFLKKKGMATNAELSVWATEREARIEKLDARFFNAEIKSQGQVSNLGPAPATPVVELNVKSNEIKLGPWVELIPILKQFDLGGSAELQAEAKGPADKLGYQALLKVSELTAKAPKLKAQPRFDGTVKIITDQVENLTLTMKAPGNDLRVQGKVVSFTKPKATFEVTSNGMDLDQLIEFPPPGEKPKAEAAPPSPGPKGATEAAASPAPAVAQADFDALVEPLRQNPLMRDLQAAVNVNIKSLKAYDVKMTELAGVMTFKELVASIDSFGLKLWGGSLKANASTDLKPKRPSYRFGAQVVQLDIQQAVASRFQFFKNTLLGKAQFEMSGEGSSFNSPAAIDALTAKGKLKVEDAAFATIDVGKMVTEALNKALERVGEKVPPLKGRKVAGLPGGESKYEFISSDFSIAGAKFTAPNFVAKALPNRGIDLKGNTTVGLKDYSLNTSWEVVDTYNLTKARDLSAEVAGVKVEHLLAEGNGPVRFPIHAGCTLMAPCYSYTEVPEYLAKVALANLSRGAQGKAKEELRKKAESLIPKNIPPAAQDKINDLRKKLFGR